MNYSKTDRFRRSYKKRLGRPGTLPLLREEATLDALPSFAPFHEPAHGRITRLRLLQLLLRCLLIATEHGTCYALDLPDRRDATKKVPR